MVTTCIICGGLPIKGSREIQSPFIDEKYTLYTCDACQSSFFDVQQHSFDLERMYNMREFGSQKAFVRSRYWQNQVDTIRNIVSLESTSLSILDVGCRTGDFLLHWDSSDRRVGVELNKENAQLATQRGLHVHNNFIERVPFGDQQFDVVSCYAVLEHLSDPLPILVKLSELVKRGGVLVIMIPSIECSFRRRLDRKGVYWHMYSPPGHLSFYSRKFFDEFFAQHDLRLELRFFTSGGISGNYARTTSTYRRLRENSFDSLSAYFSDSIRENLPTDESRVARFHRFLRSAIVGILDEHTILRRYPYFDHMYSYYLKK